MDRAVQEFMHFFTSALGIALAFGMIAAVLAVKDYYKVPGPAEIGEMIRRLFDWPPKEGRDGEIVNVEFRDSNNALMDPGPLLHVEMHNGRGYTYPLRDGVFVGCHSKWIKAGARVHVSFQGGLKREELTVRLDRARQTLVLRSKFSLDDIVDQISGDVAEVSGAVPTP